MNKRKKLDCCDNMLQAQEPGTDNEGYGFAVWACDGHNRFMIGTRTDYIFFCPWCGTPIIPTTPTHEEDSSR